VEHHVQGGELQFGEGHPVGDHLLVDGAEGFAVEVSFAGVVHDFGVRVVRGVLGCGVLGFLGLRGDRHEVLEAEAEFGADRGHLVHGAADGKFQGAGQGGPQVF
jgi:hypothetical protein